MPYMLHYTHGWCPVPSVMNSPLCHSCYTIPISQLSQYPLPTLPSFQLFLYQVISVYWVHPLPSIYPFSSYLRVGFSPRCQPSIMKLPALWLIFPVSDWSISKHGVREAIVIFHPSSDLWKIHLKKCDCYAAENQSPGRKERFGIII